MSCGIGLDIGATKTLGVITDAAGHIDHTVRTATRPGPDGVVETVVDVVGRLRGWADGDVWPVGLGVPGLVDADRGAVKHAVNLGMDGDWFPLRAELEQRLGLPVTVENDVNAAAVGATALQPQDASPDLAYLSLGTGLAAGLVLDGRLRRGVHSAAGEIGHIPVDPRGSVCRCGQRGCFETVASGAALAAAWPGLDGRPPAQALFDAANAGDDTAAALRDRFTDAVASAVRLLCLTVDVRVVVVGGGVAQVGEPLRAAVAASLNRRAEASGILASLRLDERLVMVPSGHPVAALGAALLGKP